MSSTRNPITYGQFAEHADARCRTLSRCARPTADESACTYTEPFDVFLRRAVFPVWFVDPARSKRLNYCSPNAEAVLLREWPSLATIVSPELKKWYVPNCGPLTSAEFMTLHCLGCDRHALIDGVHRALWLAVNGFGDEPIHVTELSGSRWPADTPDLNLICGCSP